MRETIMPSVRPRLSRGLVQAERLTLGVLLSGVFSLALSDFVSPAYWLLTASACLLRFTVGPRFALGEMQASMLGWAGFFWVGAELAMGRAWLVALTDFLLILSLAVSIEIPTPRNHLHRLITGTFLILAASVLTDSVLYALPLTAFLLLMWRACRRLYGLGDAASELSLGGWREDWAVLAVMLLLSALLFVLAPRFDMGSGLKNIQPRMQLSGFSDAVHLGDFARQLDPTIVMRVEVPGMPSHEAKALLQNRYWRGVVLSRFEQGEWRQEKDAVISRGAKYAGLEMRGDARGQGIVLYREAVTHPYLMLPDGALRLPDLPAAASLTANGSIRFMVPPASRLRVKMDIGEKSLPRGIRPPLQAERRMPDSAVIRAWAGRTARGVKGDVQRTLRLAATLQGWEYNLQTAVDASKPIEHFLLQSRSGHCEMFATSMALAARSLGIPARVVNGYYGGEWNQTGDFLVLRQQHAHAWVEVWLDDHWQRYDPTPASRWQLSGVYFKGLEHAWDTVRLSWYRYVLEFGARDRAGLLQQLGQWMKGHAAGLFLLLLLISLLHLLMRSIRWQGRPVPADRCRVVLDRWLLRHGIRRHHWQTFSSLSVPDGVNEGPWRAFVMAWESQIYAQSDAWRPASLRRHLRALERMS
ncbi:MAG: DUF3488 and transglutaminase-like domain-containing protein [Mariprofundaceae bacterium]|nr:DUF3488 and transglutaminase-like domain-containing protein [Mariprofundaceae bacterium]